MIQQTRRVNFWCQTFADLKCFDEWQIIHFIQCSNRHWETTIFFWYSSKYFNLSWRRPLSYRNQSIDLLRKSMDWFLYDNGLRHERVKRMHWTELNRIKDLINFLGKSRVREKSHCVHTWLHARVSGGIRVLWKYCASKPTSCDVVVLIPTKQWHVQSWNKNTSLMCWMLHWMCSELSRWKLKWILPAGNKASKLSLVTHFTKQLPFKRLLLTKIWLVSTWNATLGWNELIKKCTVMMSCSRINRRNYANRIRSRTIIGVSDLLKLWHAASRIWNVNEAASRFRLMGKTVTTTTPC